MDNGEFSQFFGDGGTEEGGGFKRPLRPVDDGTIEVAVMPQMGANKDDARGWKAYRRVHWGFTIPNEKDPTKPRMVVIKCVRKFGPNRMVVQECALCNKHDTREEERKQYAARLEGQGKSQDEIKQLCAPLDGWLRKFNIDSKWVTFVRDAAGEYNKLHLSGKTFGDLESEMKKVSDAKKINVRNVTTLVYWAITRVGKGKGGGAKLVEKVAPAQEDVEVNGETFQRMKIVKLTDDDLRKAIKQYTDITKDDSLELTPAEIEQLVACSEDPEEVEKICARAIRAKAEEVTGKKAAAPAQKPAAPAPEPAPTWMDVPNTPAATTAPTQTKAAAPAPTPAAAPVEAPAEEDEEAALERQLAEARARKAAKAKTVSPAPAAKPAPAPSGAEKVASMTTDDLFKELGLEPSQVGQ